MAIEVDLVERIQLGGCWHDVAPGSLTFTRMAWQRGEERVFPTGGYDVPFGIAFRTPEGASVAAPVEKIDAVQTRRGP